MAFLKMKRPSALSEKIVKKRVSFAENVIICNGMGKTTSEILNSNRDKNNTYLVLVKRVLNIGKYKPCKRNICTIAELWADKEKALYKSLLKELTYITSPSYLVTYRGYVSSNAIKGVLQ